jgi:hypothetical protein
MKTTAASIGRNPISAGGAWALLPIFNYPRHLYGWPFLDVASWYTSSPMLPFLYEAAANM